MTEIISPLPFTFSNGSTADATQVNANFAQIVTQVNANTPSGANFQSVTLLGMTGPTNFTLPANAFPVMAIGTVLSGAPAGPQPFGVLYNTSNPLNGGNNVYLDFENFLATPTPYCTSTFGAAAPAGASAWILSPLSTTTFDIIQNGSTTPGDSWNGAVVNAVIYYVVVV